MELELWLEDNYPAMFTEWLDSGDEDIEGWLEETEYDILSEYDDYLDDWKN